MLVAEASTGAVPQNFYRGAKPSRHQQRRAATVLRLARTLHGDALDYGSGWGDLAARLAPQFSSMRGVDVDAVRVAFAQQEYPTVQFSSCTTSGTSFPDQSFDAVFSIVVLPFVADPDGHMQECRRLLRPGGTLVVMQQNPESFWAMGRSLRGSEPYQLGGGVTLDEFRGFLGKHQFGIEATAGFYDPPFDNANSLGNVVLSLINGTAHMIRLPRYWSYVGFRCRKLP